MNSKHKVKDNSKAIYSNYRSALRAARIAAGRDSSTRAGGRKQAALQVTADRYHLPISEVKKIVKNLEEVNGVTHEKDSGYLEQVAFDEALAQAEENFRKDQFGVTGKANHALICTSCGTSFESKLVRVRPDEVTSQLTGKLRFTLECFEDWFFNSAIRGAELERGAV